MRSIFLIQVVSNYYSRWVSVQQSINQKKFIVAESQQCAITVTDINQILHKRGLENRS